MMRKLSLLFAIFVMVSTAAGFTADLKPVKRTASPDSPAFFSVNVNNNASNASRFTMSYDFSKSGWVYAETSKTIPAGESADFNISINPDKNALQQSYSITVYVTNFETGEMKSLSDYMNVRREYKLNVVDFSVEKSSYMPGETVKSSITVQNLVPRIISDYSFESRMGSHVERRDGEPIAPRASKTYSFSYQLPEDARPGTRNISINLMFEGETRKFQHKVNVVEVRKINRSTVLEDKVIEKNGIITVENLGNSVVNLSENVTLPSYVEPVLDLNPQPDRKIEEGKRDTYIWNFQLQPGERASFRYSIEYWIPLLIAATILSGVVILRRLSGSMKIEKKVEELDGGQLKISLEIKNNTEGTKEEIRIEDFVPNVAKLDEQFDMAQPELKKTVDGVEMEWTLEDFRPDEKRVIQYRIEPKVDVEGGIDLPDAEIHENNSKIAKSDVE